MKTRKTCTKCGQTKPVDKFNRDRRAKGGRQTNCKACEARYRAENREHIREYKARYHAENRERKREYDARYHAENPEISRTKGARRRARKRGLPDDGSDVNDWLSHMEESDVWFCHLCGGAFAAGDVIHWDHRDPVSTGTAGTVMSNMAAAHAACNISRGNTPLNVWSTRVGLPEGVV